MVQPKIVEANQHLSAQLIVITHQNSYRATPTACPLA